MLIRNALQNLSTAVPQALDEMLDSAKGEKPQEEGALSAASPAVQTPGQTPVPAAQSSSQTLVKKEVLNAALAYLESAADEIPEAASSQTTVPQTAVLSVPEGAMVYRQILSTQPEASLPGASAQAAPVSPVQPQASELPQQAATNLLETSMQAFALLSGGAPDTPAKTPVRAKGQLAESPASLLAALLGDDETGDSTPEGQPLARPSRLFSENDARPAHSPTQNHDEKPGSGLLTLMDKTITLIPREPRQTVHVAQETPLASTEKRESSEENVPLWHKGDKAQEKNRAEKHRARNRLQAKTKEGEGNSPTWHPFPPAAADSSEQASRGLLIAVAVCLFATLLVISLLVLNL
ncbi:hypothetical protein [Scandinavium goeteborgense]|uniref:Uncharacterized protein n=1 Tax=Scandinavium goeteborgense TaxID=1851514 RepID=A0A4R6E6R9_SCAGO|nr:hypothetical protein [Scandinavium goeteborgense]TDN53591.1 hypothetical protein EC847_11519 [Scandinavium goeteborgense]